MLLSEVLEKHLREIQAQSALKPVVAVVDPIPEPVYTKSPVAPSVTNLPSPKQVSFFKDLVARKQLTDQQRIQMLSTLPALDKRAISSTIQWLIGLPWMPRPVVQTQAPVWNGRPAANGIPQGCYCIVGPAGGLAVEFYKVSRPTEGKWAGYVFLSQLSGENHIPIRDRQVKDRVYTEIQKDVTGALKRFGKEIGRCGHCSKQLTDEVSREFGIGPVCRKVLGL